jgi:hypothetical protein
VVDGGSVVRRHAWRRSRPRHTSHASSLTALLLSGMGEGVTEREAARTREVSTEQEAPRHRQGRPYGLK